MRKYKLEKKINITSNNKWRFFVVGCWLLAGILNIANENYALGIMNFICALLNFIIIGMCYIDNKKEIKRIEEWEKQSFFNQPDNY